MVVSVIVPTHNRASLISTTVRAHLAALSGAGEGEILVVDDGSTDGTADVVRPIAAADCRVRYLPGGHGGLVDARNRGIEAARGEVLLFCDDDLVPTSSTFLAEHLDAQVRRPGAWVSHLTVPDAVVSTPFQDFWRRRLESGTASLPAGKDLGLGGFWFATLSVPRASLGSNRFSEAFTDYGWEEHELGYRLYGAGVRARFLRSAMVEHHDRVSFGRTMEKFRRMGRMAWVFTRLHPGPAVAWWTGTHPVSRLGRRLLLRPERASRLPRDEEAALTDRQFGLCLEAAYEEGLREGQLRRGE